jgi:hypothetical protein
MSQDGGGLLVMSLRSLTGAPKHPIDGRNM